MHARPEPGLAADMAGPLTRTGDTNGGPDPHLCHQFASGGVGATGVNSLGGIRMRERVSPLRGAVYLDGVRRHLPAFYPLSLNPDWFYYGFRRGHVVGF